MSTQIKIRMPKEILWSNYPNDFSKIVRIENIIDRYEYHLSPLDKVYRECVGEEYYKRHVAQDIDRELQRMMSELKDKTPCADDHIIAIGVLNLWNVQKLGYKHLKSSDIGEIFDTAQGDFSTWGVASNKDVVCVDRHHDGTNYYLYRAFRPYITDTQRNNFMAKIYEGTLKQSDIAKYTHRIGNCFLSDQTLVNIRIHNYN